MNDKVFRYYKDLPTYAKGVVAIALTGIVGFLGYKLYGKLFPSQSERDAAKLLNSVTNDVAKFQREGLKPTYPSANYVTFANTIYQGMRYAVGDDYGSVVNTLKKMENKLDAALLIDAFGVKQNYAFGIPTGDPMDMLSFIKTELGNEWWFINRIKQINEDWSSKGIPYKI